MSNYNTTKRYCPHLLGTKLHAVALYRQTKDISFVCRRYHISKASLMPWHNGKVERSRRNDQERFYNHLNFYSFADLQEQMKRYLRRANNIPMAVLGWKSPAQKHRELEASRA